MVQAFVTTVPKVVPELPAEPSVSRAVVRVKEQSVSALESAPFGANMGGTAELQASSHKRDGAFFFFPARKANYKGGKNR